jgi:hypothetical protein
MKNIILIIVYTLFFLNKSFGADCNPKNLSEAVLRAQQDREFARTLSFDNASYHHQNSSGKKGPPPTNGQETLREYSIVVINKSKSNDYKPPRRIAYNPNTKEISMFDTSNPDSIIYHGHIRTWSQLDTDQQNTLIKAGLFKPGGKPI